MKSRGLIYFGAALFAAVVLLGIATSSSQAATEAPNRGSRELPSMINGTPSLAYHGTRRQYAHLGEPENQHPFGRGDLALFLLSWLGFPGQGWGRIVRARSYTGFPGCINLR